MKILIKDYISESSSQSMAFFQSLKKTKIEGFYWHPNEKSTFDTLDTVDPDFVIVDVYSMTKDLVYYFDQSKKNIKLIINIPKKFDKFDDLKEQEFFKKHTCAVITDNDDIKHKSIKIININPCVDEYISNIQYPARIPEAHVVNNSANAKINTNSNSYHLLSYHMVGNVDISAPNFSLAKIYNNYDRVIFYDINSFDQPFFDALYRSEKVFYNSSQDLSEKSIKLFGQDLSVKNNNVDFKEVKKTLENKHLSCHRIKQILSQLPINQSLFTEV